MLRFTDVTAIVYMIVKTGESPTTRFGSFYPCVLCCFVQPSHHSLGVDTVQLLWRISRRYPHIYTRGNFLFLPRLVPLEGSTCTCAASWLICYSLGVPRYGQGEGGGVFTVRRDNYRWACWLAVYPIYLPGPCPRQYHRVGNSSSLPASLYADSLLPPIFRN